MEDKKQYTPEELERIRKAWSGDPPKECTGKCELVEDWFMTACKGCMWDDAPGSGTCFEYEP